MGIYDRDYTREERHPSAFAGGSVVKWLLIANVAVFVFDLFTNRLFFKLGFYNTGLAIGQWQVWRFLTYQFLHADLGHILFNMIALYFFGPIIERYLGSRRFLAFYLLCGTSGAVLYSLLVFFGVLPDAVALAPGLAQPIPMVGASGSIFGILAAGAVVAPDLRVMLLFPPIPMKLKTLAMVAIGIGAVIILTGGPNAGGEAAHLGGAALGFLLIKNPSLLGFFTGGVQFKFGSPEDRPRRRRRTVRDATETGPSREEIDRVLDKITEQGMQSLTPAEKKVLEDARSQWGKK